MERPIQIQIEVVMEMMNLVLEMMILVLVVMNLVLQMLSLMDMIKAPIWIMITMVEVNMTQEAIMKMILKKHNKMQEMKHNKMQGQ